MTTYSADRDKALTAMDRGDVEEAKVYALLALESRLDRLCEIESRGRR